MSYDTALGRISEITGMLPYTQNVGSMVAARAAAPQAPQTAQSAPTSGPASTAFASEIAKARAIIPTTGGGTGEKMVALARQELEKGVAEVTENDSPDIARYRTATQGAVAGAPWCAYFTSYIARQAGVPIGENGSGMGYVPAIQTWAKKEGLWVDKSQTPKPGDLIVFGGQGHIGIVESVTADGKVKTIEGNHSNKVDSVIRDRSEPVGYVRLG